MRRRLCLLLHFMCFTGVVFAQNIKRIEYFVDSDPGYGAGTPVAFTPSPLISDLSFQVNLAGVGTGFHALYIRARDVNGIWSFSQKSIFYKDIVSSPSQPLPSLRSIEYFIDSDPGPGNRTKIPFAAGSAVTDLTVTIPVSAAELSTGFHALYLLATDANGATSFIRKSIFYKDDLTAVAPPENIIYAEYFVGNDPGYGKATRLPLTPGQQINDLSFVIDLSSPSIPESDNHMLIIRAEDASHTWNTIAVPFSKCNGTPPSLNTLTEVTQNGFRITWPEVVGAAYYELDISTDNFQTFVGSYSKKQINTTSVVIGDLAPATVYQVRISSFNTCSSVPSNIRTVATLVPEPAAPTGLNITGVTETSLNIALTQPEPTPSGYLVLRSPGSPSTFVPETNVVYQAGTQAAPGVHVAYSGAYPIPQETNLTPGTHYYYSIFSFNKSGDLVSYSSVSPLTGDVSTAVQCQIPVPDFDVLPGCATQVAAFTDKSINVLGDASYRWTFESGVIVNQAQGDATHTYDQAGFYQVELHITQSGVCKDSITKQVQIRELPLILFSNSQALVNTQTTFTVATGNLPPAPTFLWDFNSDGVVDATQNTGDITHVFTTTGVHPVTVTLTDNTGCTVSFQKDVTVTVPSNGSNTIPDFSANTVCQGTPTTITNLSQNVPVDATYEWDFDNDGVVDATTSGPLDFTYPSAGLYSSVLRINVPGSPAVSTTRIVEVKGTPVPTFLLPEGPTAICAGGSVNIASTPLLSGVTYQWKWNNAAIEAATTSGIAATTAGTYSLDITNSCGTTTSSNSILVDVLALPEAKIISANAPTELCEGETVVLSVPGQAGVTYTWSRNDEEIIGANSNLLLANQAGEYRATIINACGTTSSQNTMNVVLKSREPGRQSIQAGGPLEFCSPGKVTLSVPTEPGVNYTWRVNNIVTGTNSPSLDASQAGTYTLTLFNDCRSVQSLNTVTVVAREKPAVQNIASNINPEICRGQAVRLSVPVENQTGYTWFRNGIEFESGGSLIDTGDPGVYSVRMTNICGSINSDNVIEVRVIEPLNNITIAPSKGTTFCVGESIQLSVPAQPSASYTWKRNGVVLQENLPVLTTRDEGTFNVEIFNACFSATASIQLNHYPVPPPTIVKASLIDECDKERYLLRAEGDFVGFQWFLGTSLIAGANERDYRPLLSAAYRVQAFDLNGCSSFSEPYPVVITAKRFPSISSQGNPDSLLTVSEAALSYQWFVDNRFIVGANQRIFRVLYNGEYKVNVTYDDGCAAFSQSYLVRDPKYLDFARVASFLGDTAVVLPESFEMRTYPNPVSADLSVSYSGIINDEVTIILYNQFGVVVVQRNISHQLRTGGSTVSIDVGELTPGLYIVEIDNRFERFRTKIVKQ